MQPKSPPAEKAARKDSLSWPRKAALWVIESIFSKSEYWVAGVWLGAAGVFLSMAWDSGPQQGSMRCVTRNSPDKCPAT